MRAAVSGHSLQWAIENHGRSEEIVVNLLEVWSSSLRTKDGSSKTLSGRQINGPVMQSTALMFGREIGYASVR